MITAGLGLREKTYEDRIEHLKKLGHSLPDEPIPKKKDNKDATESTSTTIILKKDIPDKKPRVQFGKETAKGEPKQKSC